MRDFFRPLIFNPVIAIEACSKLLDGLLAPEGMLGVAGVLEPEDAAGDVSSFTRRYASYHTFQHLFFIFLLTCSASLAKYMYKGKQKTKHLLRFLIKYHKQGISKQVILHVSERDSNWKRILKNILVLFKLQHSLLITWQSRR